MSAVATSMKPELRTLAEIESAALHLEPAQRLELVRSVAASLDSDEASISELLDDDPEFWREIERRIQEVREGKVVLRDGPTVMKSLLERYS